MHQTILDDSIELGVSVMKFIVDSLPYYMNVCPFSGMCPADEEDCPRHWDKHKVTSDESPRECEMLKER